jgi:peroxiredoxin Q/BCP
VIVIGISQDTVEEHREFKHKYNINFELLSSPTLGTVKGLGAYGKVFVNGIEKRKGHKKRNPCRRQRTYYKRMGTSKIEEET